MRQGMTEDPVKPIYRVKFDNPDMYVFVHADSPEEALETAITLIDKEYPKAKIRKIISGQCPYLWAKSVLEG